ncbi:hypothetical protein ACFIOY_35605 [Bradyrhizobium sp. TZ2]
MSAMDKQDCQEFCSSQNFIFEVIHVIAMGAAHWRAAFDGIRLAPF